MIKYLHFNQKRYGNRSKFTPNPKSTVVCDVRTGNIYSADIINEKPTSPNYYSLGPFDQKQLAFFKYPEHLAINPHARKNLTDTNGVYNYFSTQEFSVALAALDRYEKDPVGNLTWPYEENPLLEQFRKAFESGLLISPVSHGASYELVPEPTELGSHPFEDLASKMARNAAAAALNRKYCRGKPAVHPELTPRGPMAEFEAARAAAKLAGPLGRKTSAIDLALK
jgi:hypothetical protein